MAESKTPPQLHGVLGRVSKKYIVMELQLRPLGGGLEELKPLKTKKKG